MDMDLMRKRLIQAREFIGYNRKQFAAEMGIPYRTVTNYENGEREPGGDYISKVADFCGCTTDWILGISDDPKGGTPFAPRLGTKTERLIAACEKLNDSALERVILYAEDLAWNPANAAGGENEAD